MKHTVHIRIVLALGLSLTLAALCLSLNPGSALSKAPADELHVCPIGCPYSSIQAAVDAANEGDIIKVATGVYTDVSGREGVTQTVYISKSITIQGGYTVTNWTTSYPVTQPTTLDAQGQGRVMYLVANQVTLSELTIQNGRAGGTTNWWGGGIYATSTLTLTNVNVLSNTASFGGGGVYAGNTATIFGGRFENNFNSDAGGGGLDASRNLTIVGTHFISNTGQGLGGGVLANSRATIEGAYFERNHTPNGSGGGIYAFQRLTLIDTQFISNTGLGGGGAHAMNTVIVSGGRFENNYAAGEGGGLYAFRNLILTGTEFIGNTSNGDGGGVYVDFGSTGSGLETSRLVNAVFARNSATNRGAALYLFDSAGPGGYAHILHTTIVSPSVGMGEAVSIRKGIVGITNSIVASYSIGIRKSGGIVTEDYNLFFNAPISGSVGSGGHSLTGDPQFVNPIGDNYHLTAGSIAIDKGTDVGITTDMDNQPRPRGTAPDLGADEYWPEGALRYVFLPIVLR